MRKLYKSNTDSRISGVCGGVAEYLGISSTWVRIAMAVTALASFGSALVVYFAASLIIPESPDYAAYGSR